MRHFTIEIEANKIMIHGSAKEADAVPNSERFGTEPELANLAADWPASRRVEIWNSLSGETPVKKFKDRPTAIGRIWRAIQHLGEFGPIAEEAPGPAIEEMAPVAEPVETALVPESETIETTQREPAISESKDPDVAAPAVPQSPDVAPEAAPATKKATRTKKAPVAAALKGTGVPREGSKASQVIAMLKCEGGTTLEEIMRTMGCLKHTTRAMLSAGGSLTKKHGLTVTSEKVGNQRRYFIKA